MSAWNVRSATINHLFPNIFQELTAEKIRSLNIRRSSEAGLAVA